MQLLTKFKKILYMGFRATLNFRKLKVALNPRYGNFLNFAKSCISSCLTKFCKKKNFTEPLKAEIKGVFSSYGNPLCHENNTNVFTNDWAVF